MANTITVTPNAPYDNTVLLQEFSEEHPDGVAFVYAKEDATFEVGETAMVVVLLERKRIKRATKTAKGKTNGKTTTTSATPDGGDTESSEE